MREIKLTQGRSTIVDDEDFEELSKHKWNCHHGYAIRTAILPKGKREHVSMHVSIMGRIDGLEIDHINGNPLDNRRENLRHVTHQQNMQNRTPNRIGISQYRGVQWHKRDKRWESSIRIDGKSYYLGSHKNEQDAALAYNNAAIKLFGQYARLNTIKEGKS